MAYLFPRYSQAELTLFKSRAERELYQLFQQVFPSQTPENIFIYHSYHYLASRFPTNSGDGPPIDGEIDFILFHRQKGALVIEVKSGNMEYSHKPNDPPEGVFWQNGQISRPNPLKQIEENKYALKGQFAAMNGATLNMKNFIFHVLAFPHTSVQDLVFDNHFRREICITREDLPNIKAKIDEIFKFYLNGQTNQLSNDDFGRMYEILRNIIFPPTISPGRFIQQANAKILELSNNQKSILFQIRGNRKAAIAGGAGSGKTVLALSKAADLLSKDIPVVFLTYNQKLKENLKSLFSHSEATQINENARKKIQFHTFHSFCRQKIDEAEILLEKSPDDKGYYDEYLPNQLKAAIKKKPQIKVEAIIVDEGQDFLPLWWEVLDECFADNTKPIFYVFFDANQQLKREKNPKNEFHLGEFLHDKHFFLYYLTENLRNTKNIFSTFLGFFEGEEQNEGQFISNGPPGLTVEKAEINSPDELKKFLNKKFSDFRQNNLKGSDVVLLSPYRPENSLAGSLIGQKISGWTISADPANDENSVHISTIHSFRGLESTVAIVFGLDDAFINKSNWQALCYIAFSRANAWLFITGSNNALEKIFHG